jgi:hypothetical protein
MTQLNLDIFTQSLRGALEQRHNFKHLIREAGQAVDVLLRGLERALAPHTKKGEDDGRRAGSLLVFGEVIRWSRMAHPALHVGQDDSLVSAIRLLEDRVEGGSTVSPRRSSAQSGRGP